MSVTDGALESAKALGYKHGEMGRPANAPSLMPNWMMVHDPAERSALIAAYKRGHTKGVADRQTHFNYRGAKRNPISDYHLFMSAKLRAAPPTMAGKRGAMKRANAEWRRLHGRRR